MRLRLHVTLACLALVAFSLPAMAYVIEAEGIPTSADWELRTLYTQLPVEAVTGLADASGGSALSIIDDDATKLDVHAVNNTADIVYTHVSTEAFNGAATAVVRMKTTDDFEFSALSGSAGWERNVILSFSDGSSWRKCLGFAVRPDGVAFTNTTATSVYGGVYAVDNTQWHTWTIVGTNFGSGGGSFDLYLDGGATPVLSSTMNGTTDTAIGYVDGLSIGGAMGGTNRDGTGSWMFDWVAVKAGADPGWNPVPEPGSLLALGSGLIGLVGFGIRRRK